MKAAVKALLFERKRARYAAAAVAGGLVPGKRRRVGPARARRRRPARAARPTTGSRCDPAWRASAAPTWPRSTARRRATSSRSSRSRSRPATRSSATSTTARRVVLDPVLACAARGIDPPCAACARGDASNHCERIAFGHLEPGLQTGFCADTGGGWSTALVAHASQLLAGARRRVRRGRRDGRADRLRGARGRAWSRHSADSVAVIGAGTLGLLTIAALRRLGAAHRRLVVTAKHPEQQRLARELGADQVVGAGRARRASCARSTGSLPDRRHPAHRRRRRGRRLRRVAPTRSPRRCRSSAPGGDVRAGRHARPRCSSTSPPLWHRETALARLLRLHAATTSPPRFELVRRRRPRPPRHRHLSARPLPRTRSSTPPTPAAAAP